MRNGTLKIKRLNEKAFLPRYLNAGSSGIMLQLCKEEFLFTKGTIEIPLGFSIQLPFNVFGLITQSSYLSKKGVMIYRENIDEDFTDEIKVKLHNYSTVDRVLRVGNVIGYLTIVPYCRKKIEIVEEFWNAQINRIWI